MSTFWKGTFKIALWLGGIALVVGGILRIFFVTPITPGHDGMAPTFLAGEKVLLWRDANVEMGDIVVCAHPTRPGSMVLGRVMAKGGMTIATNERGRLMIEGDVPDYDWHGDTQFFDVNTNREHTVRQATETLGNTEHEIFVRDRFELRLRAVEVSPGKLYLLGDNRASRTHDSRTFGPVDASTCLGTIFMRWNPEPRGEALDHGWLDFLD